jgi:hypothetical protein
VNDAEMAVAYLKVLSQHIEWTEKNHESSGREPNPEHPEQKSDVLTSEKLDVNISNT